MDRLGLFFILETADRLVALTGHPQLHTPDRKLDGGHLVLGQGAGLVGADDAGAAQGFHRLQTANEGVALDHLAHAHRQIHGDDRREPLGHGGDGEADGDQK